LKKLRRLSFNDLLALPNGIENYQQAKVIMSDIIVALSGGVDSAVAATLLLECGNVVRGLFMRHRYQETLSYEETRRVLTDKKIRLDIYSLDSAGKLNSVEYDSDNLPFQLPVDAASAIKLAEFIGVDLILLDVDAQFAFIVENFVEAYYAARTPNPCVLCNQKIKFGALWSVANQLGAQALATGHYVRKERVSDWIDRTSAANQKADAFFDFTDADYDSTPEWLIQDGASTFFARSLSEKDQSYFLYGVASEIIKHVEFPIGRLGKDAVRKIANEKGLPVAARKDSQEVCFFPDKQRLQFIRSFCLSDPERWGRLLDDTSGEFLALDGSVIGEHLGYEKYTIGQRKGLGMGFGERIFVQQIIPETRSVVLGPYEKLGVTRIRAVNSNWHLEIPVEQDIRCEIKVRYRGKSCFATIRLEQDGSFEAVLDSPMYGVAPGQALVCYWRDRLLGGGQIAP